MLSILIVDDEKLVRKGIIALVDWNLFDMEVISEAENGDEAISILERENIDVIFTDLSMPGISGIEFLTIIKNRFPNLNIVVITMHQEFEVLQSAMRLGIVDYITKAQLEQENINSIMETISKKLKSTIESEEIKPTFATVIYSPRKIKESEIFLLEQNKFFFLTEYMWIAYSDVRNAGILHKSRESALINIKNIENLNMYQLVSSLEFYIGHELYYMYNPKKSKYYLDANYCSNMRHIINTKEMDDLIKDLGSMEWILSDSAYYASIQKIKKFDLGNNELVIMFYQVCISWNTYKKGDISEFLKATENFGWWYQWSDWIAKKREELNIALGNDGFDNKNRISKVIEFIETNYAREITLKEILLFAGMSKSHFSKSFKEVTGMSFVHHIKHIRIEQAKKLLISTDKSIFWVGEQVGYNERYFRRVFMQITKMSPSEYKKAAKAGAIERKT